MNVREFGAVGDGKTKDTEAIQRAIDACSPRGGEVILEDGVFISGTLYLHSHVTLRLSASAVLLASPDIRDYGEDTHYNRYMNETDLDRCLIYAQDAKNITLCGEGAIDGNAACFPNEGADRHRPMLLRFLRCEHVRVEHLKLINAAAWTCAFLDSRFIWATDLYIENHLRYNGDGLDFDGCSHVWARGCHLEGTDDNLCLQASDPAYPMEDVHISDCSFTSVCAGIRIGLKSVGTIRNVAVSNCTMHNVWREGIKIECTEGGEITDIRIQNVVMRNVSRPLFMLLNNRFVGGLGSSLGQTGPAPIGRLARVHVTGLTATDDEEMAQPHLRFQRDVMGSPRFNGIRLDAAQGHEMEDIPLTDICYTAFGGVKLSDIPADYPEVLDRREHPGAPVSENYFPTWSRAAFMDARNVRGLTLSGLNFHALHTDERPPMLLTNCK